MSTKAPVEADRVLVVDDESDIVALVAYHLAKAGYRVSTAADGAEAVEVARRERPSIVVLDLMLPGMSGYDVLQQFRNDERTRDVGVLLLTARREEPDRIRGLSLGADDYLTKPFSPQELVLRVGAILRRLRAGGGPTTCSTSGRSGLTVPRAPCRLIVRKSS
jgi:two-component system, OmpR family, phosphate regulon response regulator PhoB